MRNSARGIVGMIVVAIIAIAMIVGGMLVLGADGLRSWQKQIESRRRVCDSQSQVAIENSIEVANAVVNNKSNKCNIE